MSQFVTRATLTIATLTRTTLTRTTLTRTTLTRTTLTRAAKFIAIIMSLAVISSKAFALDPTYTTLFSSDAIKGYDTVAYFTENAPVKGKSEFSTEYQQATWLFSSQENLDLFKSDPEKYAPQYGGYCAYAVSQGSTASIKPELFTIHDGKLYLNYNESINKKWSQNKDDFIRDADQNWPKLIAE